MVMAIPSYGMVGTLDLLQQRMLIVSPGMDVSKYLVSTRDDETLL